MPRGDALVVGGLAAAPTFVGLILLFGLVRFGGWVRRRRRRAAAIAAATCEVRRISLAFDWTERARLQEALEALAGDHDMGSERGMFQAAHRVFRLLERSLGAVRYGMWTRHRLAPSGAESKLQQVAVDLRARFTEETVRNAERRDAAERAARPEDGEGLVVVSVVIGATVHRPDPPAEFTAETLRAVLAQSLPARSAELVALEVVWSPSADADRMSSREVEQFYPELRRLDAGGALGGRSCGYCRAVFAAELGECPACGAPIPEKS